LKHRDIGNRELEIKIKNIDRRRPKRRRQCLERCGRGLFSFDRVSLENTQADHEGSVAKPPFTMTSANFISKVKQSIAQAFAPAYASALA
jgi:hypothetical protein